MRTLGIAALSGVFLGLIVKWEYEFRQRRRLR